VVYGVIECTVVHVGYRECTIANIHNVVPACVASEHIWMPEVIQGS